MRAVLLAMLGGLFLIAPADAATTKNSKQGASQPTRTVAAAPARPAATLVAYRAPVRVAATAQAASVRGHVATSRRDARAATVATRVVAAPGRAPAVRASAAQVESSGVRGWSRGIDPASFTQTAECPDGTLATLADGHTNITRCMPL